MIMPLNFAVALNCGEIKTGATGRDERTAKHNRLLEIKRELSTSEFFLEKCFLNKIV